MKHVPNIGDNRWHLAAAIRKKPARYRLWRKAESGKIISRCQNFAKFCFPKKSFSQNLLQKNTRLFVIYFFKINIFAKICQNIFTKTFPLYRTLLTSCAFFVLNFRKSQHLLIFAKISWKYINKNSRFNPIPNGRGSTLIGVLLRLAVRHEKWGAGVCVVDTNAHRPMPIQISRKYPRNWLSLIMIFISFITINTSQL